MKKILGCLLFTSITLTASSQTIFLETGKVLATFDYKNSDGDRLGDLSGSNENNVGLGARMALLGSAFHVSLGGEYFKLAATSSDPTLGNYLEWDASFAGANLGFDYEFFKPSANRNVDVGFSFYVKGAIAADFLLSGTRKLNSQATDLTGVEEFDKPLYFIRGGIGGNYYISRTFVVYAQYMFGRSSLFGDYTDQEQLRFLTHTISIGLGINLFYNR
jgi:hypothetical protein